MERVRRLLHGTGRSRKNSDQNTRVARNRNRARARDHHLYRIVAVRKTGGHHETQLIYAHQRGREHGRLLQRGGLAAH